MIKSIAHTSLILLFLLGVKIKPIRADDNTNISLIKKICLINFSNEISSSTEKISNTSEIASTTCDCFIEKVTTGFSIAFAQEQCKREALIKYDLPK